MNLSEWETHFEAKICAVAGCDDPAHDLLHFRRVVAMAKKLCIQEGGRPEIVVPAAWLHDVVIVPKDHPLRSQASRLSGEKAVEFLASIGYPAEHFDAIRHAVEAHSFSAAIETRSLEAMIVQDADRLDGLGAIGVARCFATAGLLKRQFYSGLDPFCQTRQPDDAIYTVDHFFKKLFKTATTLKTVSGREEGARRVEVMQAYLRALEIEIYGGRT
jgi:uncharacterized protein